jgi:hypothetical protein
MNLDHQEKVNWKILSFDLSVFNSKDEIIKQNIIIFIVGQKDYL